jgi:signal recognition particle receptor subunit beta
MALINHAKKEINAKIVIAGPPASGKGANINAIYKRLKADCRGTLKSMAVQNDKMLFFDFASRGQEHFRDYQVRFHLYTLVGPIASPSSWKMVLKGVDGIVFVVDSGADKLPENIESLSHFQSYLRSHGSGLDDTPCIIQYNKRDRENALPLAELERALNASQHPSVPAVARNGEGVLDCLSRLLRLVITRLQDQGLMVQQGTEQLPRNTADGPPDEEAGTEESCSVPDEAGRNETDREYAETGSGQLNYPADPATVATLQPEPTLMPESPEVTADGQVRLPVVLRCGEQQKRFTLTVRIQPENG